MADISTYVFLFALMALAVVAGVWVFKSYLNGQSPTSALFGPRPEKRLAVVEHANVDGRRRLILVRRDGVEHLIMTGGPVDVVIETGNWRAEGPARGGRVRPGCAGVQPAAPSIRPGNCRAVW